MFIYGEKFADSQTQAAEITPKVENVRLIYLKTFFWTKYAQLLRKWSVLGYCILATQKSIFNLENSLNFQIWNIKKSIKIV